MTESPDLLRTANSELFDHLGALAIRHGLAPEDILRVLFSVTCIFAITASEQPRPQLLQRLQEMMTETFEHYNEQIPKTRVM